MASPPSALPSSTAHGPWVAIKELGTGNFGKVELCQNNQTGERAAVKLIPRGQVRALVYCTASRPSRQAASATGAY